MTETSAEVTGEDTRAEEGTAAGGPVCPPQCPHVETLIDLHARLHKAIDELNEMAERTPRWQDRDRLLTKASGVSLALSYLHEYGR